MTSASELSLWLPALPARPTARLRLICFPYAGGGVPVFRTWPAALPQSVELRVAQLPGRGARLREERYTDIVPLLDDLDRVITPLLDRPFALFGHSLGAVLAFEMARRLTARGFAPVHLFVSGNIAPQLPDPSPKIHQLPDGDFLDQVTKLGGMPRAVLDLPELLEIMLPAVRSDFCLLETHRYHTALQIGAYPITVFGGTEDPRTTEEGLEAWREQTTGPFERFALSGDHFFVDSARTQLLGSIIDKLSGAGFGSSANQGAR